MPPKKTKMPPVSEPSSQPMPELEPDRASQHRRLLAAVSYLGALFIIPVILGEDDEFVAFHVRQGAVMCAVEIAAGLVGWVPLVGWTFFLAVVVVVVMAFFRTLDGQKWEIPFVADYAARLKK